MFDSLLIRQRLLSILVVVVVLAVSTIAALVLWLLPAQLARTIEYDFERSGRRSLDLARAVPQPWERVCFLGPYVSDEMAREILGFEWEPEMVSMVQQNDGIILLVFVGANNQVEAFSNQWRRMTDFAAVSHRCFPRSQARFVSADGRHLTAALPTLLPTAVPLVR